MSRRAPLQQKALLQHQLESSVHAMAPAGASSAARSLWQRCVHDLRGGKPCVSASSARAQASAAVATGTLRTLATCPVGDGLGRVSEQSILRTSFSWGRAAVGRDSCTAWLRRGQVWFPARHFNFAVGGSSISGDGISSWERFSRLNAMPLSTTPATDHNASEESPSGSVTLPEAVVAAARDSEELEFTPVIENTPSTPLVQAIQSLQESVLAEEASAPQEQLRAIADTEMNTEIDTALDSEIDNEIRSAESQALLQTHSDRVVQPGRIYIGGLPYQMKGDELRDALRELCGKYGIVMDVNLAQHRNQSKKSIEAGKHRGFAFVMMETAEQAQEVIEKLNGASVWGRVLMVSYGLRRIEPDPLEKLNSKDGAALRCKVFVGSLDEGTSRRDLLTKFQQYGSVVDVQLITEVHSNRSRGFGFVTFANEEQAIKAVLDCDGSILDGSVIRVNIAKYPQGY